MPVDSHLEWNEIRDFTPGLWTREDQLMPPNAAQTMTDCYPLKGGGLRAWYKPTAMTTSGVGSTTNETVLALFAHEKLPNRAGGGTNNDWYLLTFDTVATTHKLYRMDATNAAVVWTLIRTFAAGGASAAGYTVANYVLSDGVTRYACFAFGAAASADNGIWIVKYSDGSQVHQLTGNNGTVANYQSRLIANGSIANSNAGVIFFTDPGALTNMSTNQSPVDVSEGIEQISSFATFSPGDLIVFKTGAPIYLVEGDLTNYTVRQMNGSKINGRSATRGPQGVMFLVPRDGIYVTPDGSQIMPMSKSISGSVWPQNPGGVAMVFHDHWLFTQIQGLILDTDTGAWFQSSFVTSSNQSVLMRLVQQPGFLVADNASPFTLNTFTTIDGSTSNRAESYTWKSAPIRHQSGRQIEIRSIEVYARSRNGATSTIQVTVDGTSQTVACDSSGRGGLSFYFVKHREELDITVTAASNAAGVEAPLIEVIRVGAKAQHFLRPVADVG